MVGSGLPKLESVLFFNGIMANLIIISQLCDQGLKVILKKKCLVIDEENNVHMREERSKDNCYVWRPRQERKVCEACQIMSVLKRSHQIVLIARKLRLDPVEENHDKNTNREGSSHMIVDKRNFGIDIHVFDDVYFKRQRRKDKMRNVSSLHKSTNVLWVYIYWIKETDIRN